MPSSGKRPTRSSRAQYVTPFSLKDDEKREGLIDCYDHHTVRTKAHTLIGRHLLVVFARI